MEYQNQKPISEIREEQKTDPKVKVAQLERDSIANMLALVEVYEKTDGDTILLMQVMAELYEKNLELETRLAALEGGTR